MSTTMAAQRRIDALTLIERKVTMVILVHNPFLRLRKSVEVAWQTVRMLSTIHSSLPRVPPWRNRRYVTRSPSPPPPPPYAKVVSPRHDHHHRQNQRFAPWLTHPSTSFAASTGETPRRWQCHTTRKARRLRPRRADCLTTRRRPYPRLRLRCTWQTSTRPVAPA